MSALFALLVGAAPVFLEPWGLALTSKDDAVIVAAVRSGSPAQQAGFVAGERVLRLVEPAPTGPTTQGTLYGEALAEVTAWLRQPKLDRAVLHLLDARGRDAYRALQRNPFRPKTGEELRKLTPMEQSQYFALMMQEQSRARVRSDHPGVYFDPESRPYEVFLDPETGKLTHASRGGATGAFLYTRERVRLVCQDSRLRELTVRAPAVAQPTVIDLRPDKIYGYSKELLLPVLPLATLEKCAARALVIPLELELACESGTVVRGREKLKLAVRCEKAPENTPRVFSAIEAWVNPSTVPEGTAAVDVRPPFDRNGPPPLSLSMIITDPAGRELSRATDLWKRAATEGTDDWTQRTLPPPKAPGKYWVRNEGVFADGSKVLGAKTELTVLTAAEAGRRDAEFRAGSEEFFRLQERIEKSGIDLCDAPKAMAWLKAQPEVASVHSFPDGQYSYLTRAGRPVAVHCHPEDRPH